MIDKRMDQERKILIIKGQDFVKAKETIENYYQKDPWLILDNSRLELSDFLKELHYKGSMPNSVLSRLKVCKNIQWSIDALALTDEGNNIWQPLNMVSLLKFLRKGNKFKFIFNDNISFQAEIIQQLIFLGFPLDDVEFESKTRTAGFEKINYFIHTLKMTRQNLLSVKNTINSSHKVLNIINELIKELRKPVAGGKKLAIAASKKSGKSTLLNCLLGEVIAPSSNELATPNSCSYSKSVSGQYCMEFERVWFYADNSKDLQKLIATEFTKAQSNKSAGFTLPDMSIYYPAENTVLPDWQLIDTPGPDAKGTRHRKSAVKNLEECNAAIFLIDYQKYLLNSEEEYLDQIKSIFNNRFSSLVLVLNKMDLAMQDSGAKSWIMSLDFIRNRLRSIDENFSECIIFPTSALIYANLLNVKGAIKKYPDLEKLFDEETDWLEILPSIKRQIKKENALETLTALSNLGADAARIADILGINRITASTLWNFSGILQLINYLKNNLLATAQEFNYQKCQNLIEELKLLQEPSTNFYMFHSKKNYLFNQNLNNVINEWQNLCI